MSNKIDSCKVCKVPVRINEETCNLHITEYGGKDNWTYVCSDCAESYFCDQDIKNYKEWCQARNIKPKKSTIEKIQRNEL